MVNIKLIFDMNYWKFNVKINFDKTKLKTNNNILNITEYQIISLDKHNLNQI